MFSQNMAPNVVMLNLADVGIRYLFLKAANLEGNPNNCLQVLRVHLAY